MVYTASYSKPQKQRNKLATIAVALLIFVGLVFVTNTVNVTNADSGDSLEGLTRDTMFQGAATIAGLAIFGSTISIRIYRRPGTRDAKWWAGVFTYAGITALVAMQSWAMIYACCMDIDNSVTSMWISITTVLLIMIGAFLIITSSREDENKRISESMRIELKNILKIISTHKIKTKSDKKLEYTHEYISHDVYDSLLATGHIRFIKYDIQQEIQNIIKLSKRHNEYLGQVEQLLIQGYIYGNTDNARDIIFLYQQGMMSYEKKIKQDI